MKDTMKVPMAIWEGGDKGGGGRARCDGGGVEPRSGRGLLLLRPGCAGSAARAELQPSESHGGRHAAAVAAPRRAEAVAARVTAQLSSSAAALAGPETPSQAWAALARGCALILATLHPPPATPPKCRTPKKSWTGHSASTTPAQMHSLV
jgi:hypothetical protein